MGGYGPYVWGAYGVAAALVAAEIIVLVRRECAARASRKPDSGDRLQ